MTERERKKAKSVLREAKESSILDSARALKHKITKERETSGIRRSISRKGRHQEGYARGMQRERHPEEDRRRRETL